MTDVLVVAEHRRGELRPHTAELVSAGAGLADELGGGVKAVAIGADAHEIAGHLSLTGVDEVLVVPTSMQHFEPVTLLNALAEVVTLERPRIVLFGHTVDAMGLAPALAARLQAGFASDVLGLTVSSETLGATREAYGGKLLADLELTGTCAVVTVRPGAFDPAERTEGVATRELTITDPSGGGTTMEHLGFEEAGGGEVDIAEADFLLAVGRGIGGPEELEKFEQLAERMGGTLAVSRPLVDAGWATSDRQVGQSGKTVKPRVYLALGISGAIQHLAGIRDAGLVIAVNEDSEAPIFGVCDYGAVADLFDVADELAARFP